MDPKKILSIVVKAAASVLYDIAEELDPANQPQVDERPAPPSPASDAVCMSYLEENR